ncbi:MAG TPA: RDD family protein [Terriglobales bacterium]|nr:RDD family protein [Terriglobales bacterium]
MSTPTPAVVAPELSLGGYLSQPGDLEGVGFWPRVGARLIDTFVLACVSSMTAFVFTVVAVAAAAANHQSATAVGQKLGTVSFTGLGFGLLGDIAYHTICEGLHGSTVGKRLLGMVVVQEDASPCRVWPAALRSLAYYIDSLFFGVVGYFAMQKTLKQQRHGDAWAHTVVCKRTALPAETLRSGGRFFGAILLAFAAEALVILASLLIKLASQPRP